MSDQNSSASSSWRPEVAPRDEAVQSLMASAGLRGTATVGWSAALRPHDVIVLDDALAPETPTLSVPAARVDEAVEAARRQGRRTADLLAMLETERALRLPPVVRFAFTSQDGGPATVAAAGGVRVAVLGALVSRLDGRAARCTPYGSIVVSTGSDAALADDALAAAAWLAGGWPDGRMPAVAPLGQFAGVCPVSAGRDLVAEVIAGSAPACVALAEHTGSRQAGTADLVLVQAAAVDAPGVRGAFEIGAYGARALGLESGPVTDPRTRGLLVSAGRLVAHQAAVVAAVVARFEDGAWSL
jgi:hypothetical protein